VLHLDWAQHQLGRSVVQEPACQERRSCWLTGLSGRQ